MHVGRLLLGTAAVAAALFIIIGEQVAGVSSDAVVNARLSTVRAPIAGRIDMPFVPFGTELAENAVIGTVSDDLVDGVRRDDLAMEVALAAAEVARLEAIGTAMGWIGRPGHGDSSSRQSAPTGIGAEPGPGDLDLSARTAIGSDEIPDEIRLTAALAAARARAEAFTVRLEAEERRVGTAGAADLVTPGTSVLWEVLSGDGEVVQRGQDVAKTMICGSALVTLSVPDHIYATLSVGQHATFRLDGTTELYDGTITRMAGAGAETIYRNLAIAPSLKHLERYDIALLVPELRTDPALRCTAGQTGRVFFERRPLDWLRSLLT